MKEDTVKLEFGDEFMLDAAERRLDEGDYFGALTLLNKREAMHGPLADGYALAADVYEQMELWDRAQDCWFRFLDVCNEADFAEGYEGLAVTFMNQGNDFQSAYYYHRALDGEEYEEAEIEFRPPAPDLRLVHVDGVPDADPEALTEGLALLKTGDLEGARRAFSGIDENSSDFPSAAGLAAMCTLLLGDEAGAEKECVSLAEKYPRNVQILTTYCAVLGAKEDKAGAKRVARMLSECDAESTDDLYRVATALCETGLDEEAFGRLSELLSRLPYDENVLWFYAVAAYKTGRGEDAIEALETLTTVYPRKAVAKWYLERLRTARDEGGSVPIGYYYRMPEGEYSKLAAYMLRAGAADDEKGDAIGQTDEFAECFRIAFDEMEGRDEKLQLLSSKVAVKCYADHLLREVLLDCAVDEMVKLSILHDLTLRNEEESYGVVVCNLYKEFFTHKLEIGRRMGGTFLTAFADVYSKYALLGEEHENKLCAAAEEVYAALADAGAWEEFESRAELAAVIYREARLKRSERDFAEICKLFDADRLAAQRILNYLI